MLGCLVIIPSCNRFPFAKPATGRRPCPAGRQHTHLPVLLGSSSVSEPLACSRARPHTPFPTEVGALSRRHPECAGSLSDTGLLSPNRRKAGANPAQPDSHPRCPLQLRKAKLPPEDQPFPPAAPRADALPRERKRGAGVLLDLRRGYKESASQRSLSGLPVLKNDCPGKL